MGGEGDRLTSPERNGPDQRKPCITEILFNERSRPNAGDLIVNSGTSDTTGRKPPDTIGYVYNEEEGQYVRPPEWEPSDVIEGSHLGAGDLIANSGISEIYRQRPKRKDEVLIIRDGKIMTKQDMYKDIFINKGFGPAIKIDKEDREDLLKRIENKATNDEINDFLSISKRIIIDSTFLGYKKSEGVLSNQHISDLDNINENMRTSIQEYTTNDDLSSFIEEIRKWQKELFSMKRKYKRKK